MKATLTALCLALLILSGWLGYTLDASVKAEQSTAAKLTERTAELVASQDKYQFLGELQQAVSGIADACRKHNATLQWIYVQFPSKGPPEGKFGCSEPRTPT